MSGPKSQGVVYTKSARTATTSHAADCGPYCLTTGAQLPSLVIGRGGR
jgi:hypothetical protein